MIPFFSSLLSVGLIGLISFVGAVSLAVRKDALNKILVVLVGFAAGALFGDAFIHLIPEAYQDLPSQLVSLLIILGILIFFVLEKFVRWRHCHIADTEHHDHPVAVMNLIGDGVHNFIDGLLIASSFMVSQEVGVATTLAVILHEIPSEIGDFGVLLHSGMSVPRALWYNFVSAITAFLGVFVTFIIGAQVADFALYMLPIAAGGFIYIAGSDLIPELHHETNVSKSVTQFLALVGGIIIMYLLLSVD